MTGLRLPLSWRAMITVDEATGCWRYRGALMDRLDARAKIATACGQPPPVEACRLDAACCHPLHNGATTAVVGGGVS